ncbi:MAG: BrnA antitoxin family protein [Pseudomonadota bacterium]
MPKTITPTLAEEMRVAHRNAVPNSEIDFSDIPNITAEDIEQIMQLPAKQSISIRLDHDVLEWLKSYGPGYQTRINALLRAVMEKTGQAAKP